jgi:hypothetical protein
MSDTTPTGDDAVLGGFDQTNDQVGGLEGESGGTADGEARSEADRDDAEGAGDPRDEVSDPVAGDTTRSGGDRPEDGRSS